jgi:hypothetical protein
MKEANEIFSITERNPQELVQLSRHPFNGNHNQNNCQS